MVNDAELAGGPDEWQLLYRLILKIAVVALVFESGLGAYIFSFILVDFCLMHVLWTGETALLLVPLKCGYKCTCSP